MTEKEAIEILKDMNDGYTFQNCKVCVSDNKFNEKKGICESKTCEYLNAIKTVLKALEEKDKIIDLFKRRIVITENEHEEILKIQEKFFKKDFQDCLMIYFRKKVRDKYE